MRKASSTAVYAALLATLPISAQSADVEPIGIVSQLQGKWTRARDQKVLADGDEIFPNNTVRCDPSTTNTIRIALFDGSIWSKVCTPEDPCDGGTYRVAFTTPDRTFLGFLKTYFSARPRVPIIFTASRSIGAKGPKEAVLVLNGGTLDLTPTLDGIPTGKWRVTLSDPAKARDSGIVQDIDWPKDTGLRTGILSFAIYALDVESATGQPFGPPSAVLVTDPDKAKAAREEFDKARDLAEHWAGMDSTTIQAFLVQALYAIQLRMQP